MGLDTDELSIHHLKLLGPWGLLYLTILYNLSFNGASVPDMWKEAIIVPLLMVGKPRDLGSSYRPLSLLSPVAKVLERLVLHRMAFLPLRPFQHGFRSGHSTTTALLPLVHAAASGFNEP